MTNPNDTINVILNPTSGEVECSGLTNREYFAAMLNPNYDEGGISIYHAENVMGFPPPKNDPPANFKYWVKADAKFRVMLADALIEALNETP